MSIWNYLLLVNESLILVTISGVSFSFSFPEGSFFFFSFLLQTEHLLEAIQQRSLALCTVTTLDTYSYNRELCFFGTVSWHRKSQLDKDLVASQKKKENKILLQRGEGKKRLHLDICELITENIAITTLPGTSLSLINLNALA